MEVKKIYYFICVGSPIIAGDLYGPLVGSFLKSIFKSEIIENKIEIIGDLKQPIVYKNLNNIRIYNNNIDKFYKNNINDIIIIIDSALGNKKDVGKIIITKGNRIIGNALNKGKRIESHICINGIVEENKGNKFLNYIVLKRTKKENVIKLAIKTVEKIKEKILLI